MKTLMGKKPKIYQRIWLYARVCMNPFLADGRSTKESTVKEVEQTQLPGNAS